MMILDSVVLKSPLIIDYFDRFSFASDAPVWHRNSHFILFHVITSVNGQNFSAVDHTEEIMIDIKDFKWAIKRTRQHVVKSINYFLYCNITAAISVHIKKLDGNESI